MFTVDSVRSLLGKFLWVAGLAAGFTTNKTDDQLVDILKKLVDSDDFLTLVVGLLNKLQPNANKQEVISHFVGALKDQA